MAKTIWIPSLIALVVVAYTRAEASVEKREEGTFGKDLIETLRALIHQGREKVNYAKREWAQTAGCDGCNDDWDLCCKGGTLGYGIMCTENSPCCMRYQYYGHLPGYTECEKNALKKRVEEKEVIPVEVPVEKPQLKEEKLDQEDSKKEIEEGLLQLLLRKIEKKEMTW